MTVLKLSHQDVCQVIFAVFGSVFLSLPVHRQRVVVIFRVLLLEKTENIVLKCVIESCTEY